MTFPLDYLQTVFLLTARHSAVLWLAPPFGLRSLPVPARLALALLVSMAILPPGTPVAPGITSLHFYLLVVIEVLLGATLGFAIYLTFGAIRGAGAVADMQLGLGMATVFDPSAEARQSPVETLSNYLGILLFFTTNSHHQMLLALKILAKAAPPGSLSLASLASDHFVALVAAAFEAAVRLALPVLAITLLVDVSLAVASRLVPQLQPFFVGAPLKSFLGLGALALSFPAWGLAVNMLFDALPGHLLALFAR